MKTLFYIQCIENMIIVLNIQCTQSVVTPLCIQCIQSKIMILYIQCIRILYIQLGASERGGGKGGHTPAPGDEPADRWGSALWAGN